MGMNLTVREVMGKNADTARTKHLATVLQVPLEWRINNLSDGQRRRCQLLEILATPRPVYLMDEITSDLDIFARDGVLDFLKTETDPRCDDCVLHAHIRPFGWLGNSHLATFERAGRDERRSRSDS